MLPELKTHPAVFAVKDEYQIMVPVHSDLLFWVSVDGEDYYDHSNGIVRSAVRMHRVHVPMEALDRAEGYTVHYRKLVERKPYFTTTEDEVSQFYVFHPVRPGNPIRIYHLADTHGNFDHSFAAGSYFGDGLDVLVLNGDIPDHSGAIENFDLIYQLCSALTGGTKPCVFSRGNHDTRGFYAENIAEYTPVEDGHSYFSFRLGPIWGLVLDCGEDKADGHEEYGHTVCCHQFRREETRYLENLIRRAGEEYEAEGVEHCLVIAHNPFTYTMEEPFDIEQPLFGYWTKLLREQVKPQAMLCGHIHATFVSMPGSQWDSLGQPCPVIVGSDILRTDGKRTGCVGTALTLDGDTLTVAFTDQERRVLEETQLKI